MIRSVPEPADAFIVFELGRMLGGSPTRSWRYTQPNRKKGWGAIAKELGIKGKGNKGHGKGHNK